MPHYADREDLYSIDIMIKREIIWVVVTIKIFEWCALESLVGTQTKICTQQERRINKANESVPLQAM